MRSRNPVAGPIIMRLGEVIVNAEKAIVLWPQQGDSIAVDFAKDGYRFANVYDLDSEPRIVLQPAYADLLSAADQVRVLKDVVRLWEPEMGSGA